MAETEAVKSNPRPIIRIGLFFMSHSLLVSVVCYGAGIFALLLLPILSKNTYISENALMPGSASPMLSNYDVSEASRFMNQISSLDSTFPSLHIEFPRLIAQHISAMGGEVNHHKFGSQSNKQHPLRFFTSPDPGTIQDNFTCSSLGTTTVGIIRATRGDRKEAILLVTPYNSSKITSGEVLALGIGYSVFSLLSRVTWLAKDIIWLASDSRHGEYTSVAAWLREYHTPLFGGLRKLPGELCLELISLSDGKSLETVDARNSNTFRRAGTMAAALVVKVVDTDSEFEKDALTIYAEASNGQMPNLDLINIVNYLAVYGQGLQVRVEKMHSFLNSQWLKGLGGAFELMGKIAKSLNAQWNFDISIAEYIEGSATLASSLYNQALGVPTGSHGAFRDYQIDAVTMEISHQMSTNYRNRPNEFLNQSGRLIEGVIRCINNLLEKFHQSFFLYLLTSPNKFVSVGVYMIPFALLVAPLPVVAAALFSAASLNSSESQGATLTSVKNPSNKFKSWRWLKAAKYVFIVHFSGVLMTLLPYLSGQISEFTPETGLLIWIVLPVISLLIFINPCLNGSQSSMTEWMYLKSVTIASAFIGLSLMSVINFATAEIGAILLVPICLMAAPLHIKVRRPRTFLQGACNVIFAFLGFPPLTFFVLKGALQGFDSASIVDFWTWMVSLWEWSSATYVFICIVHLPCWALCVLILLQRS